MKAISKTTKTYKLFSALQQGQKLTAAEANKRFGIKNISAEASRIRAHGYAVYANSRKAGNGVQVTTYEIGAPSRNIVALGYKAAAMGITL
jgi:Helix-turn-helix domain